MNKPNILLVLLDGCRADRLGCYGYKKYRTSPTIDALAKSSIVAMNHYSTSNCTMPAVISMMTGMYPCLHKASSSCSYYDGSYPFLTNILQDNGYYTFGISNNVAAMSPEWGFIRGYDTYYRIGKSSNWFKESKEQQRGVKKIPIETRLKRSIIKPLDKFLPYLSKHIRKKIQLKHYYQNDMGGEKAVETFARALKERNTNKPFFGYVNLPDTHHPYFAPKDFFHKFSNAKISDNLLKLNLNPSKFFFDNNTLNNDEINLLQTMYDRCVAYSDYLVSKLLSILESTSLKENTVIIFASDHGGMLYEKNKYIGSTTSTYQPEIKVPLIVYNSGISATKVTNLTSVIDIFPTILNIAQIDYISPNIINGISIFNQNNYHNEILIDYPKYPNWLKENLTGYNMINFAIFSKVNRTLISRDGKKIIWTSSEDPEFYDLCQDPKEEQNIFSSTYNNMIKRIEKKYKSIAGSSYNYTQYSFNDIGSNSSNISLATTSNNKSIVYI